MRILLGTATFYPDANGVSTFLQHLGPMLREHGHEILIVAPSTCRKDEHREYKGVKIFGIRSMTFPLNKQFRFSISPAIQSVLQKELDAFQPDLIHVQDPFPICLVLAWIAKKRSIPIVGTHHTDVSMYEEYYFSIIPPFFYTRIRRFEWQLLNWYFALMDAVTTPTTSAARPLQERNCSKDIQIISNGIDLERFHSSDGGEHVRQQYNLPKKPILLTVGRLDPEKNVHHILQALPTILGRTDVHFLIVGKGTAEKRLRKQVQKLGIADAVTFAGFVPNENIPELYRIADCFIVASSAETQGIVTMEAMASGLPIVAANAMALPELVRDGENGFLFPPGNTVHIAERIIKIFSDTELRKSMSRKSMEYIEKHDFHYTAEAFESLYRSLVKE